MNKHPASRCGLAGFTCLSEIILGGSGYQPQASFAQVSPASFKGIASDFEEMSP